MSNILSAPIFHDETKAREWVESQVWSSGARCPHCGNFDQDKLSKLEGEAHRAGVWKCYACREQFTVTVGTVFERSKIPLTKWVAALFLMTASKIRRIGAPDAPYAGRLIQEHVVHDAPLARG